MNQQKLTIRLPLGRQVITPNALDCLHPADVVFAMQRHVRGDWGKVCPEDWQSNQDALVNGERILSVYEDRTGREFWIITEACRSATTVLLPEDY